MKFLLVSQNYSPELTGIGKYNGDMCTEFVKRGIDVSAVVAPPYYPEWQVKKGYSRWWYKKERVAGVDILRCPLYVPKKVKTVRRLIHLLSFAFTSGLALMTKLFSRPDVIFLVQPTLFCAPMVLLYSKLTGAKSVMHIQDFEVDAMFGLGMVGEGRIARWTKKIETWLMRQFDLVSTISFSMMDKAKSKGVEEEKIIYFPNWSNTDFVSPDTQGDVLKKEWGFDSSDKIVLYAGNIGHKQGLEIVLEAARDLSDSTAVKFVIVGAGAHLKQLMQQARKMNLINLFFKPLEPWERVPEMLALADIHLVVQKKGAADAVLPSKLTNILSAGGHALITTELDTELGRINEKFPGIYSCVEPENTDLFVGALRQLLNQDLTRHNPVARQYALDYLAKDKILNAFVSELEQLVGKKVSGKSELKHMQ